MSGNTTIRRGPNTTRRTSIPNKLLADNSMSIGARWLACYLMSRTDVINVPAADVLKVAHKEPISGGWDLDRIGDALSEMVDSGWADYRESRDENDAIVDVEYVVLDRKASKDDGGAS